MANVFNLEFLIDVNDKALKPALSRAGKAIGTFAKATGAALVAGGAAIGALTKKSVEAYGAYEQLVGGAQKIFDEMDYKTIAQDAKAAYETMNLSASEYLEMMNSVGATFSQTMGDAKGYESAKTGMQAIADYASGTGRNVAELNQKFSLITRSTSSYQSIADQFSGILPATSKGFLEAAQASGFLSDKYKNLTQVPVAEYQEAVSKMLEKGVADLGLAGNAADESSKTITGSLAATKAAWQNLLVAFSDKDANLGEYFSALTETVGNAFSNIIPVAEQALKGIGDVIGMIAPVVAARLPEFVNNVLPSFLSAITGLITSISTALPQLIGPLLQGIISAAPEIIKAGILMFAGLATALVDAIPMIIDALPEIWEAIKEGFVEAWPALKEAGTKLIQMVGEGISAAGEWIAEKASEIWEGIKAGIVSVWDSITEALSTAWETIKNVVMVGVMFVGSILEAAWDIITLPFRLIWENCKEYVMAAWDWISGKVSAALEKISNVISTVWGAISSFLAPILDSIKGKISSAWDAVKSVTSSVWSSIKSAISSVVNSIKAIVGPAFSAVSSTVSSIWTGIKSKISGVMDGIKEKIQTAVDFIKNIFNFDWHLPDLKLPTFKIVGSFSLNPPSVPKLSVTWNRKALNEPFMFTEATLFGAGEAGDEVLYGKSHLMDDIRSATDAGNATLQQRMDAILALLEQYLPDAVKPITLDGDLLVGGIRTKMDNQLGELDGYGRRGLSLA